VGAFTSRSLFFNALRFVYTKSEKTDLEFEINQSTNLYPDQISSYILEAQLSFNYKVRPKLSLGLQGIFGLDQAQYSPDQVYQILNARCSYDIAGKLVLKSSAGIQFIEYASGGEAMRIIPVFSVGADYQLFQKTSLELNAYRNLQNSPSLEGQDYIATGFDIGLEQHLSQKIKIGLAIGYENDTYVANMADVNASRVDNFYFFRPGISYSFLKYLDANFSYEYRTNASNTPLNSWFDNRLNCELSLNF
jgi:hypothetical protein